MLQIIIILGTLLIYLYILIFIFTKYAWKKEVIKSNTINSLESDTNLKPIKFTVVIPARNEENNISSCLESILLSIKNNSVEIIIVNDFSSDHTEQIVTKYIQKYDFIKLINLKDYIENPLLFNSFKKKAIEIAINKSSGNWIIQTDADCIVANNWIQKYYDIITKNEHINCIIAPVAYIPFNNTKGKEQLFSIFQRFDFMTMQGITAATHFYKIGFMSNGANFAYSKSIFNEVNGFESIDTIASGDDMLLVQKIAQNNINNVHYVLDHEIMVHTSPPSTIKQFINQRIRWGSKSNHYKDSRLKGILLLVYLTNIFLFICMILSFFNINILYITLILLSLKTVIELTCIVPITKFFDNNINLYIYPLLQPLHIIYIVIAGTFSFKKSYQWKNRKTI